MDINARCFLVIITCSSMLMCSSYGDGAVSSDVHCLRSIKQSVEDPLNSLHSWKFENLGEVGVCSFVGIYCYGEFGAVSYIYLNNMGLKGPFPRGLENCTSLTRLDLSNNFFSGPLPSDIGNIIPFVTSLDLSFNRFSSNIPNSLAKCTRLYLLHLQNNQFHGKIPQQIGLLKNILDFNVSNNYLSGQFPRGLENFTSLIILDLSNNSFSGPIPSDISHIIPFVTGLNLSFNQFSGKFSFSGTLPSDISHIIPFVTDLDLSFNQFSGKLPDSLAYCTRLNVLRLQNNQFHGEIPQQFGLLTLIREFNVSNNFLSGPVPTFGLSVNPNPFVTSDSYANNTALCGVPLEICEENEFKDSFKIGFVVFWVASMIIVVQIYILFGIMHSRDKKRAKNPVRPMTTDLMARRERRRRGYSN